MTAPHLLPPAPGLPLGEEGLGLAGSTASGTRTLVVGCGNLLRGDDAAGPVLVRHLAARGTPPGVRLADGGTAGMDVAFAMRGQDRVVVVDACTGSGHPPGTVFRVPGERLEELPPPTGINLHAFRWDSALAFGRWLLKEEYPADVVVWLVEGESLGHGDPLSAPVEVAVRALADRLLEELAPQDLAPQDLAPQDPAPQDPVSPTDGPPRPRPSRAPATGDDA